MFTRIFCKSQYRPIWFIQVIRPSRLSWSSSPAAILLWPLVDFLLAFGNLLLVRLEILHLRMALLRSLLDLALAWMREIYIYGKDILLKKVFLWAFSFFLFFFSSVGADSESASLRSFNAITNDCFWTRSHTQSFRSGLQLPGQAPVTWEQLNRLTPRNKNLNEILFIC